jgi:uncharacterized membrane protein YidH (DUF202 family)
MLAKEVVDRINRLKQYSQVLASKVFVGLLMVMIVTIIITLIARKERKVR